MSDQRLAPAQQAYLEQRLSGRSRSRVRCPIPKRSFAGPAPLSFAQEGIWFASQLTPDVALYNVAFTIPLPPEITRAALLVALDELARRHEILRTDFPALEGIPVQRVRPDGAPELTELAGGEGAEGERADEAGYLQRMVATPFALAEGPLWRCCLVGGGAGAGPRLFVVIHHLICDGWSASEMWRQLLALCPPSAPPTPAGSPEGELQYADFAVWQRRRLESGELERQLRYWREKIAGAPAICTFPADRPRSATPGFRGATRLFEIGSGLTGQLQALARREEASFFMVLLAAFKVLLWRYSGQADVVVGSPFACRPLPVLEPMLGCFVNMLPLRTTLASGASFLDMIARVKQTVLEAYANEEYPFDRIVEAVRPVRSLAVNPLFQTVFALQSHEVAASGDPHAGAEVAPLSGTSKFDLTLVLSHAADGLVGAVEYDADLFDGESIRHLVDHFLALLASLAGEPGAPIGKAEIFAPYQQALLVARNDTAAPITSGSLLAAIESQARRAPEQVAVSLGGRQLSHGQLRSASRSLARRLRALGAQPDDLVGICLGPSLELLPAILGVLAAGCAYVPLDPGYPEERLVFMLRDAEARIVITEPQWTAKLAGGPAEAVITAEMDAAAAETVPETYGEPRLGNLAYMIYTSGSTGEPKGAKVSHRGLANLIQWFVADFGLSPDDRFLVISSFSFDLTQKDLLAPLYAGVRIVFPDSGLFDPQEIARIIERESITVVNCTPSAFSAILDAAGRDHDLLASLRWVILGGEPIALEPLAEWLGSPLCHARIANTYGPTECSDVAASFKLDRSMRALAGRPVPIGGPIFNTQLAVVDGEGRLAPLGAIGELWIAGAGVGEGYHRRPELNAEKFVAHRFEHLPVASWYRTGDLVRYSAQGELVFVGRSDHQLKLRGFRVELEEIEHVLTRTGCAEAAVALVRDGTVCAFVTPAQGAPRSLRHVLALEGAGTLANRLLIDLPNGLPVVAPNRPETEFLYQEIWGDKAYFRHGITFGDGACVFDIGANTGLFSLFVAQQARAVEIYAFEPLPPLYEMLRGNLAIHEVAARCFALGLGSRSGTAEFTYYPHVSIISGMHGDADEDQATMRAFLGQAFVGEKETFGERDLAELVASRLEAERFVCPLRTLSEVIAEQGVKRIDLLKVDVEKSELEVLAGIRQQDWPLIQQVVLEVHDRGGSLATIVDMLRRNGFTVACEQASRLAQTRIHNVYARRPGYAAGAATRDLATPQVLPASPRQLEKRLRELAAEHLPDFMVPSSIVVLERFPTTPSGKVDRAALATMPLAQPPASRGPRTTMEEELAALWREILQLGQVGVDDNFFEVGGHSLKAAQLAARVRQEFAVEFSVRTLFQHPRISALADYITSAILREIEP
jgi:amino acid adenylation domain-containing protein/FkbM family methyltransferase